jgi:hypothetical protein
MKFYFLIFLFVSFNISAQTASDDFAKIRNASAVAYEQSEFSPINKRIPLLPSTPSLEQLIDIAKPNKNEKDAIFRLSNMLTKNSEEADAIYRMYFSPPSFVIAINENRRQYRIEQQNLFVQLVTDKLTYGEFNTLRRDLNNKSSSRQQEIMKNRASYQ